MHMVVGGIQINRRSRMFFPRTRSDYSDRSSSNDLGQNSRTVSVDDWMTACSIRYSLLTSGSYRLTDNLEHVSSERGLTILTELKTQEKCVGSRFMIYELLVVHSSSAGYCIYEIYEPLAFDRRIPCSIRPHLSHSSIRPSSDKSR